MRWNVLAVLPLIFLGAGASLPEDCTQVPNGGATLPTPVDLAGRPVTASGLAGNLTTQTFAALPSLQGESGCAGAPASALRSDPLHTDMGDALHGLPAPDILRRIDEPRRAPLFQ